MSAIANVKDGKIVNNNVGAKDVNEAVKASQKQSGGALDKDAFLQLLVTQMKYQDPLEPTDNTEYVSQLATFSELEEMQNMVQTSDRQRASVLVGQYVSVATTDSTGNTKMHEGYVDSVIYQGNKTYLQIEDILYDFEDLDTVYDNTYVLQQAAQKAAQEQANNNTGNGQNNQNGGNNNNNNTPQT